MRFTKSIICLTLFAAFSTAYAGSKYLNGSSGITQNKWDDENIVAGVFLEWINDWWIRPLCWHR